MSASHAKGSTCVKSANIYDSLRDDFIAVTSTPDKDRNVKRRGLGFERDSTSPRMSTAPKIETQSVVKTDPGTESNQKSRRNMVNSSNEPKPKNRNEPQYTNQHMIHIDSSVATESQIRAVIEKAIKEVQKNHYKDFRTLFRVNVVSNRAGKLFGYSYVWFTNPEAYNLILGRNLDGTERAEYYDDPNWTPPEKPLQDAMDESFANMKGNRSWVELTEEEERIQALYSCPQIKRVLPHLMPLDSIEYEPGQYEQARQLMIDEAKRKGKWTEGMEIKVPERINLVVGPAVVTNVDPKYCHNVLCCLDIPPWITDQDIREIFLPYRNSSRTMGTGKADEYPKVTVNRSRNKEQHMAFVTFDPRTHDAQFCLMMTRKFDFTKGNNKHTLIFNHAFKTN